MITQSKFNEIRECYGYQASWAVWADAREGAPPTDNVGNIKFFDHSSILSVLNPRIVIVGLNISRDDIAEPFANFHSPLGRAKDYKLRYALKDTPLWGAYMTDILKDIEEVKTENVLRMLQKSPQIENENVQSFLQEISSLVNGYGDPLIVAMGQATYSILKRNFKRLSIDYDVIKIQHYSHYIGLEDYRDDVLKVIEQSVTISKSPEMIAKVVNALHKHLNTPNRTHVVAKELGVTRYLVREFINDWIV
jgi:hypothetical protein